MPNTVKSNVKNYAVALLLASSLVYAKDKSMSDYPLQFEVLNEDLTGTNSRTVVTGAIRNSQSCDFWVRDNKILYHVENRNVFTCHTWVPGTTLDGRLAKSMGVPYIEFAWLDASGKVNTQKYTLLYRRLR